jgi:hypothetical protein
VPIPPPPPPRPEDFKPENFRQKTTARDYAIYSVVLVIVLGLVGGAVYYFTRSPEEQSQLRARAGHMIGKIAPPDEERPKPLKLKPPKLDGLMEAEEAPPAADSEKPGAPRPVLVSAYAGGGQTKVLSSSDPKLPQASPEFITYATNLKVNGVLPGNQARAMLNGRLFHVGDTVDADLGVVFAGVDGEKKFFVLRDKTGAELHVTY